MRRLLGILPLAVLCGFLLAPSDPSHRAGRHRGDEIRRPSTGDGGVGLDAGCVETEEGMECSCMTQPTVDIDTQNGAPFEDPYVLAVGCDIELEGTATFGCPPAIGVEWYVLDSGDNLLNSGSCVGTTSWACTVTLVADAAKVTVFASDQSDAPFPGSQTFDVYFLGVCL